MLVWKKIIPAIIIIVIIIMIIIIITMKVLWYVREAFKLGFYKNYSNSHIYYHDAVI